MATISRFRAVASVGNFRFFGFIAWLLWLGVHIVYLIGFKNRVSTVFHWAISFVGDARAQRSGVLQQAQVRPVQQPGNESAQPAQSGDGTGPAAERDASRQSDGAVESDPATKSESGEQRPEEKTG